MNCNICNHTSDLFLTSTIFKEKTKISYYKCSNCGFIQTEEAYWLEKAYSSAITKSDIGLIARNIYNSNVLEKLILNLFPNSATYLDYAGGYGMFVRIMRDKGFDFYWQDDYCENIFVTDFVGDLTKKYDIITAYEVFEHLPDPNKTIEILLSKCNILCFSTEITDNTTDFDNWWYRGEVSGQHISFYSKKTLQFIANKYNVHYYSFENNSIHVFAKDKINDISLNEISGISNQSILNRILNKFKKNIVPTRESLLSKDYNEIIKKQLL